MAKNNNNRVDVGDGLYRTTNEYGIITYHRKKDDQIHRDNGPAMIAPGICGEYYQDGKIHRDSEEPAVVWANKGIEFVEQGKRHNAHGPAVWTPEGFVKFFEDNYPINTEQCGEFQLREGDLAQNLLNILDEPPGKSVYLEEHKKGNGFCWILDGAERKLSHELLLCPERDEDTVSSYEPDIDKFEMTAEDRELIFETEPPEIE